MTERKYLVEKCQTLEDENQNLLKTQNVYQQEIEALQDGLSMLNAENELVKKQYASEHQTVTCT